MSLLNLLMVVVPGVEITRWLQRHGNLVQIPHWLALDDLDLAKDGGGETKSRHKAEVVQVDRCLIIVDSQLFVGLQLILHLQQQFVENMVCFPFLLWLVNVAANL